MINLLNPEQFAELQAARLNFKLRRYIIMAVFAALGVVAIYGGGYWFASNEHQLASNQHESALAELKNYEDVKKRMTEYRANLAIADKILGTQLVYSDFLVKTAQAMPENTILASLALSTKATVAAAQKGLMTLEARTKSYDDALRLKESLEASPMFSDVRLKQTSTPEKLPDGGIERTYPFQASYTLKLDPPAGVKP